MYIVVQILCRHAHKLVTGRYKFNSAGSPFDKLSVELQCSGIIIISTM